MKYVSIKINELKKVNYIKTKDLLIIKRAQRALDRSLEKKVKMS